MKLESLKNKKVIVTGHTGFKGSWLCLWLQNLGARVLGISNGVPTKPAHIDFLGLEIESAKIDIRDQEKLELAIREFQPDCIIHMAAHTIVKSSYKVPVENYATNIMGSIYLFEAARKCPNLKAIVNVTSDKCYLNREEDYSYKEEDSLGGYDPYSASKACAEIITSSYRNSFFNLDLYGSEHQCLVASVRAGNVIGGGDWAEYRLLPDIFRSYGSNECLVIKNPMAVRPWQFVLEPLKGYLQLACCLIDGKKEFAGPWNFGPDKNSCVPVCSVLDMIKKHIPNLKYEVESDSIHEANLLMLDSSKAKEQLNWSPKLNIQQALELTANWYKCFFDEKSIISQAQLDKYLSM